MFAVKLVEKILAERADEICHWPRCTQCGARIENKGREDRQIKSLIGIIRWDRKIGRCPNGCEIGQVVPLDKELGIAPNQRVSNELKRAACALAIFVPYRIASVILEMIIGRKVSDWAIWDWVQKEGNKEMENLGAELDASEAGEAPPLEPIEQEIAALPMVIGVDGVNVPFRPNGGSPVGEIQFQQVNVGIIARLKRYFNRRGEEVTKIERKRMIAVLGNVDETRDRLWLEAQKQGIQSAYPVIWLSDGAIGFWRIFHENFAHWAYGILDFYHAAQNIWKAARIWLDGRTDSAQEWFVSLRHTLRHGQPCEVLFEINRALTEEEELSAEGRHALENLIAYFGRLYQFIEYARYEELGFPLGSGIVESACKWLVQQRFKMVGMRWSEDGFNHLLHLRLAWVNGRFDSLFSITSG